MTAKKKAKPPATMQIERTVLHNAAYAIVAESRRTHVVWVGAGEEWLETKTTRSDAAGDKAFHRDCIYRYDLVLAYLDQVDLEALEAP